MGMAGMKFGGGTGGMPGIGNVGSPASGIMGMAAGTPATGPAGTIDGPAAVTVVVSGVVVVVFLVWSSWIGVTQCNPLALPCRRPVFLLLQSLKLIHGAPIAFGAGAAPVGTIIWTT